MILAGGKKLVFIDESTEVVIVSDVHIRSSQDERHQLLIDVINSLNQPVRYFVLLGDIFDFCFGYSKFFKNEYSELANALLELNKRGVKVIYLEGNHEFHSHKLNWPGVEFFLEDSIEISLDNYQKVLFMHGDLLAAPTKYLLFRKLIKSKLIINLARILPDHFFYYFALKFADTSRSMDQYRSLDHAKIIEHARRKIIEKSCDLFLFGHFHIPYAESLKESTRQQIFSCKSWNVPNLMLIDKNGNFSRRELKMPNSRE
ncbi:MAG: UDP-2,3-diacylglucosamine diphosphatase [Oligoflexales bacterium]|nr:UDP-2,3-diacylglucosamine diphosphatase [Oligoflexales bacterium]